MAPMFQAGTGCSTRRDAHLGELRQAARRHGLVPGLVGVDDQLGAAFQGAGEVAHAGHVGLGRLGADLHLEGAMQPGFELALGLLHLLRRVAGGEGPEHGDAVAHRAAEQGGGGQAEGLAHRIEQRRLDRRLGGVVALGRLVEAEAGQPRSGRLAWPMMAGAR